MWYISDGCDIYVICCVCSDRKQKTKKTKIFGHFAECNTWQIAFAECLLPWHSAKLPKNALPGLFAVYTTMCFPALPSARTLALGKEFSKKNIFSLPSAVSARHSAKDFSKKKIYLPSAGSGRHSAKDFSKKKGKALSSAFLTQHSAKTPSMADGQFSLPSARQTALGKEPFAGCGFAVCSLPSVALGKAFAECNRAFAECPRHSAKSASPVVCCGRLPQPAGRRRQEIGTTADCAVSPLPTLRRARR